MKKENAITLISLVVTIIILIILAGVTINILLGDNGIITKSKEAKTKQEIAEIKEKLGLDILDAQMEAISRNENLEQEQLEDIISKYGQLQEDKDTIILKDDKGTLSLLDIYKGTTVTEGSYSENKAKIELLERQVATLQKQLDDASKNSSQSTQELLELRETLSKVTVTEDTILKNYVAYKDGKLITGKIEDRGAWNNTPTSKGKVTIPAGYHNGSGYVDTSTIYNNAYSEGYKKGNESTNQTMILYFGGKEILASDKAYGGEGGQWMQSVYYSAKGLVVENIDPKIFATVRYSGTWAVGSCSGDYPNQTATGYNKCYFVDKITGETVLEVNSSGRPFTRTIDCSQFTNPVDMYIDAYISTSSYGDPWATCTLGNVYLKVRDDYQG